MIHSSLVKLKLTYTNNTSGKVLKHMILKVNSNFLQSMQICFFFFKVLTADKINGFKNALLWL